MRSRKVNHSHGILLTPLVNAILGDHNVDKQMTDSRGDVIIDYLGTECIVDRSLGCIFDG